MKQWVSKIRRYLRLYFHLAKFSMEGVLVYRINSLLIGLAPIVWMITAVIFFSVIFKGAKEIAGWSFWELMLLTGVQELVYLASWVTYWGNLIGFTYSVNLGKFDLTLLRPANHRFLVSFGSVDITSILSVVNSIVIVSLSLINLKLNVSFGQVSFFLLGLVIGYLIIYLLSFIFASSSLFWVRGETFIRWLLETLDFDRYPAEIYSDWFKVFLLTFLPILFLAYVPTAILLGKLPWYYVIFGLIIVFWLYAISTIVWRSGLRHYQSASS